MKRVTGDNIICKETCILIDHHANFLDPSGICLNLETPQKQKSAPTSFLHGLTKSTWTCIVEGTTEYCRIVYDLFTPVHKVLVLCSDVEVANINYYEDEYQNISQVLKGFGDLGPPNTKDTESNATLSLYTGVAQGVEELIKYETMNQHKRIIIVTDLLDESDARSISNVVWEMQNQHDKTNKTSIDLVIVNVSNSDEEIYVMKKEISPSLDMTILTFSTDTVATRLALLVREHYSLCSTIVTGIPMKEEQNAGTSANYDVEVIHSSYAHQFYDTLPVNASTADFDGYSRSFVTLKWCTPKASNQHELLPCLGAYKVTPTEVNSRPAACLIMFLLQGRTVMLEEPKKANNKVLSHMLSSHGGDVYIHVLCTGRSPLDEPPSISEGLGGRVTDYRVNDFGKFMKENRLAPYKEFDDDEPNKKAIHRLERYSRYWPMVISDTLIFNMQPNLEPLLSNLLKPSLTDDDVQDCKKVVYKLQAMESKNDALPLPLVTLKGKPSKKEEQYKQLWLELDIFIEGASKTSTLHKKVLDCIRGTQDTQGQETKQLEVSDPRKSESKIEKEVSKNSSSETDKKSSTHQVPSDPRRRRRMSESSNHNKPMDVQPKSPKSPKSPTASKSPRREEPPTKMKRSSNTSFSSFNGKSSLFSIWTDHLNLTASRMHEEFEGRKQSINGKFELYKKDPEQNNVNETSFTSKSNSKSVKEWV